MGRSEQHVRHDGDINKLAPAALPEKVVRVDDENNDFLPIPVDELNTATRLPFHDAVITDYPIEVLHTTRSIPDPDVIKIAPQFERAVNTVLTKLDEYAKANGAQVEPSSVRSSITGPISWLLTRKGVAEWVRRTFPVEAFDLTRVQADGTTRRVCQVQIAKGVFSGKVQVIVPRYPGGETEGDRVENALGLKRAPRRGPAPTKSSASPARAFASALDAQIAQYDEAQKEAQTARKRLGLKPSATASDVQELERLVHEIEIDVKHLLNHRACNINFSRRPDGTYTVLDRSHRIAIPDAQTEIERIWKKAARYLGWTPIGGLAVGACFGAATEGLVGAGVAGAFFFMGGCIVGLLAIPIFDKASAIHSSVQHSRYLRKPLLSKEPGSLGAIVEKLHEAGLGCDIRVGAWDRKELRVDLTVSYKPTEEA